MGEDKIRKYNGKQVRSVWDDLREEWWFSVVDVVGVLTEQDDARKSTFYWSKLKERLKEEGADELLTNCQQLKTGRKVITSDDAEKLNPMKDLLEGIIDESREV